MKKDEKIKILSELAAMYPEVRYVVSAVGEEKFIKTSYDIVAGAQPVEFVEPHKAVALATEHPELCWGAWYDFHPLPNQAPTSADLGFALITLACVLFENALDDAWDGYVS